MSNWTGQANILEPTFRLLLWQSATVFDEISYQIQFDKRQKHISMCPENYKFHLIHTETIKVQFQCGPVPIVPIWVAMRLKPRNRFLPHGELNGTCEHLKLPIFLEPTFRLLLRMSDSFRLNILYDSIWQETKTYFNVCIDKNNTT